MSEHRDFKDRKIDYEINLKCNSIDVVRTARIKASERLYGYAEKWELIFLAMSIVSNGLLIYSLINPENSQRLTLSALFSIYSLLIQNFVAKLNYNERALRFHYHQLDLEDCILQLKSAFLMENMTDDDKYNLYQKTMEKYQASLQGYENHSTLDHYLARKSKKASDIDRDDKNNVHWFKSLKNFIHSHDFSWNKILIWVQYGIIPFILIWYILLSL